ncbi:hypothetical protein BpHYR1_024989 [Brachionus plicatilis]|uniref:Uncharacterized protein n=1 Tax=Brachionus plicatilis TaxID=10195 RepID=A0A3M7RVT6_BRAPC|nr:hypothetical protein BpHYR1_024989 [Brachionus plicatilis]
MDEPPGDDFECVSVTEFSLFLPKNECQAFSEPYLVENLNWRLFLSKFNFRYRLITLIQDIHVFCCQTTSLYKATSTACFCFDVFLQLNSRLYFGMYTAQVMFIN